MKRAREAKPGAIGYIGVQCESLVMSVYSMEDMSHF